MSGRKSKRVKAEAKATALHHAYVGKARTPVREGVTLPRERQRGGCPKKEPSSQFVCVVCSSPASSLYACSECGALVGYSLQSRLGDEFFEALRAAPTEPPAPLGPLANHVGMTPHQGDDR